jgi:hypothetical protein
VQPAAAVDLLDPDARAADERERRLVDFQAIASGKISERALHDRNALTVDEVTFELPSLA